MAEWLKAHISKACVRETVPWVRIRLSPPATTAPKVSVGAMTARNAVTFARVFNRESPAKRIQIAFIGAGEWIFLPNLLYRQAVQFRNWRSNRRILPNS